MKETKHDIRYDIVLLRDIGDYKKGERIRGLCTSQGDFGRFKRWFLGNNDTNKLSNADYMYSIRSYYKATFKTIEVDITEFLNQFTFKPHPSDPDKQICTHDLNNGYHLYIEHYIGLDKYNVLAMANNITHGRAKMGCPVIELYNSFEEYSNKPKDERN